MKFKKNERVLSNSIQMWGTHGFIKFIKEWIELSKYTDTLEIEAENIGNDKNEEQNLFGDDSNEVYAD